MAGVSQTKEKTDDRLWDYFGQFEDYHAWQSTLMDQFGGVDGSFQHSAVRFFVENIVPFVHLLNAVFFTIGFIFIMVGFNRLRQHGHAMGGGKQVSPMGTIFHFLSGAILMNYAPVMTAISNSLFDYTHFDLSGYASSLQNSDSILYYVQTIQTAGNDQRIILRQITFGLLMVIGLISFARGLILLVKAGEGGGPEAGIGKAITHIIAGLVGVNGLAFWKLMNSIVPLEGS